MDKYRNETIEVVDFKNLLKKISEYCRRENDAAILEIDGVKDMVLLPYENYKRMEARLKMLEMLLDAEEDVKNGKTASLDEVFTEIKEELSSESFE